MAIPPRRYDYTKPIPGQQIAPVLKLAAPDIDRYMRPVDQKAFAYTAWWFNVFILVRRSNPESIQYIGQAGFSPKGPDTKAKTAQFNFYHPELGRALLVAGLVCNPRAPGLRRAYKAEKYEAAVAEWDKFVASGRLDPDEITWGADGRPSKFYLREKFFVDMNPASDRYGALMQSPTHLVTAASYIHGDYDLFAIVPADDPSANVAVAEQHLASPWHPLNRPPGASGPETDPARKSPEQKAQEILNFRGKDFMDVQNMLNRRMGVTMVLHGSQEKAVDSFDEDVDVFFPDGERSCVIRGEANLRRFYEVDLKGRKLFNFMGKGARITGLPIPGAHWRVLT